MNIANTLKDAKPGDKLVFFFSGHGGQAEDEDGDEEDGMDETICTADEDQIIDDDLHEMLVAHLPKGVNLFVIFDCKYRFFDIGVLCWSLLNCLFQLATVVLRWICLT